MTPSFALRATTLAAAAMLCSAAALSADTMSRSDYKAHKTELKAQYKTDKKACSSQSGNAKDICIQQAKGREKVALAQLEFDRSGLPGDQARVDMAKANAEYAVAKERCDDAKGSARSLCATEANTAHTKAMSSAKMGKKVDEARTDARSTENEANLKMAKEKCATLSGSAKNECLDAATARYHN